ncbi:MAG: amidohydrolase family protein [Wenzhouxiangellaceae bacterium]|nr:amidohydrolase family protein [Wenzhouxiangellaceae bacterium]
MSRIATLALVMSIVLKLVPALALVLSFSAGAEIEPGPDRATGEGPFEQLILRGAMLVDGTGAPPIGPVDIVIEGDRIAGVHKLGAPGVPIEDKNRPELAEGGREIDVSGHYVLPGFVDMHGHIGGKAQGTPAEYVYKLWLGHGITTVRDPGAGNGLDWTLKERRRSAAGEIAAPRILAYVSFGQGSEKPITTAKQAREWVRGVAEKGADGIKFFGARPEVLLAAIDEAKQQGLRTAMHHAQMDVARSNVLDTARAGLTTMEHWYGLPEALFADKTIQHYPAGYNYANEYDRFAEAGKLWRQAAGPGHPHWQKVRDELIELDFTLSPTMTIYEANRDFMAARTAEWHNDYTLPSLWDFYAPSRQAHGSYWFAWSTQNEADWKDNYRRWMAFVNDYKNHGGRVTAGSDSGFIYKLYGFGYIEELELLQEAGLHPLEVLRAATLHGAEALGINDITGSVEVGKQADLVIVAENPLADWKVLYGTGAVRVTEDNEVVRTEGVRYTVSRGILYDAVGLRGEVREMVRAAWEEAGRELRQPGVAP